jgi:Cu(I)/Ag(I) efflux system membrane fusion protein
MTAVTLRTIAAPLAAAAVTAGLFTGGLWAQHARGGWPFDAVPRPHDAPAPDAGVALAPADGAHSRVAVDAAAAASLDVRLETVGRQSLSETISAVATVVPDESRMSHVHTRVSGWIEHLAVNTTGELVRAGQPLAHIFSQELFSSQTEYLAARRNTAAAGIASAVVAGGRTRLGVLGMTPAEIDAIEQSGEPRRLVTVVAPRSGVVVNRGVTAGTSVDPSTTLLTIADLSRVWVFAEVPEASIPLVRAGMPATLDFPASGRAPFAGRIDFVYPLLTERTRTLRVRLSAANPGGSLKPGLFGTATVDIAGRAAITVPRDAVVDTGQQQHVFVAAGDRFEPRPVVIGAQLADRVEIRDGLREGEQVVVSGVFLLDSESRLRATGGSTGGHNHGTPPPAPATPADPLPDPHGAHRPPIASAAPPADPHAAHQMPAPDPHAAHRAAAAAPPADRE